MASDPSPEIFLARAANTFSLNGLFDHRARARAVALLLLRRAAFAALGASPTFVHPAPGRMGRERE